MNLSFVVVGDETLTVECLKAIVGAGHDVPLVISRSSDVAAWANARGIACRSGLDGSLPGCDYLVSAANLRMLPQWVLDAPRVAAINFHDGPLPKYAGLNAPVWALLEGARRYGVTWHLMTAEPDAGDVLEQELFELDPGETALSLNTRCFEAGLVSFERLLRRLAAEDCRGRVQDRSERTYFGADAVLPNAGVIDPSSSFETASRLVRALDFGSYPNPVGSAWLANSGGAVRVGSMRKAPDHPPSGIAGTIHAAAGDEVWLELGDCVAALSRLTDSAGYPVSATAALELMGLSVSQRLVVDGPWLEGGKALARQATRSEKPALAALSCEPGELPFLRPARVSQAANLTQSVAASIREHHPERLVGAFGAFITALTGKTARVFIASEAGESRPARHNGLYDPFVPTLFEPGWAPERVLVKAQQALGAGPTWRDLGARHPGVVQSAGDAVAVSLGGGTERAGRFDLVLTYAPQGSSWSYKPDRFARTDVEALDEAFAAFCERWGVANADVAPVSPRQAETLAGWNQTEVGFDRDATIVSAFEAMADSQPGKSAVSDGRVTLTYAELESRANRVANRLVNLGAGPGSLVAVHMERTVDLVVALLGILKSGAAYVPVDPEYPAARKSLMVQDSRARLVVTDRPLDLDSPAARPVRFDDCAGEIDSSRPTRRCSSHDLAYVIYTSGSTGRPKGVMLEHRNVINFFHGMDDRIGTAPGKWLAVTSVSFDISVLELFWTLARGFEVVINGPAQRPAAAQPTLSLFFFGSDPGSADGVYDSLFEAARFADERGFEAVWTPERHFHAFGGAFPNPSVMSAALAAATHNIGIRAGSCVLPLHSPIRVAEEWALVDRVSHGRVGISFATGWQPNDFVIKPAGYGTSTPALIKGIEDVRALWRGERREFPGHDGEPVSVSTLPRPVRRELPVWLTSAGDPETFRLAGAAGFNVLTHLLGQSVEELAQKVQVYRDARRGAGHEGPGQVTLMLHAYVSESDAEAREVVREPMISYLGSSVGLIRHFATSFPTFRNASNADGDLLQSLSPEEMRELLEIAFDRYYETSGLFGDASRAAEMLRQVKEAGVDEVACLIDFGVAPELVMASLRRIADLHMVEPGDEPPGSIAKLIMENGVTHFQCTPSMAGMLAQDPEFERAAGQLKVMMVGGEAFPSELAGRLSTAVGGRLLNMYGPTETTIWSTTAEVRATGATVSIGTPIANTFLYILGPGRQPLPPGAVGELWIGGEGVARGYLGRADLTAERFLPDPFTEIPEGRMYKTGDLARFEADGSVTFLGRADQQVKVRGYRIEPAEIEAIVLQHPGVSEAVVIAREDVPGDHRLVCYYASTAEIEHQSLRDAILLQLPAYMAPTNFVRLERIPLTPNKKVDRNALPRPGSDVPAPAVHPVVHLVRDAAVTTVAPETLAFVAQSWSEVLSVPDVPRDRTFFDCGGNSLLLLRLHKKLLSQYPALRLTDLFHHATVNSLAAYLGDNAGSTQSDDDASRRALARRTALGRRPVHA